MRGQDDEGKSGNLVKYKMGEMVDVLFSEILCGSQTIIALCWIHTG